MLTPGSHKRYRIKLDITPCPPRDNTLSALSLPRIRDEVGPLLAFGTEEHAKFPLDRNPLDTATDAPSVHDEILSSTRVDLYRLPLSSGNYFRYGQIIALAGDLFETFDDLDRHPVSRTVWDNHEAISNWPYKAKRMSKWEIAKEVWKLDRGTPWREGFTLQIWALRYLYLAQKNFSHFRLPMICRERVGLKRGGPENAVDVYSQLHMAAINEAKSAGWFQKGSGSRGGKGFKPPSKERAFAMNAFADHFLTDLFSTGHMRTPRHEIHYAWQDFENPLNNEQVAVAAHDEDNKNGLWVRSPCVCPGTEENHGREGWFGMEPWQAFGDGYLDKAEAKEHNARINAAVNVSIYEVNDAYNEGAGKSPSGNSKDGYGHALQHVPIPYLPGIGKDEMKNTVPWDKKYAMDLRNFPVLYGRGGSTTKLVWYSTGDQILPVKDGNTFPRYVVSADGHVWQRIFATDPFSNVYVPFKVEAISGKIHDLIQRIRD